MEKLLEKRYEVLFSLYGVFGNPVVIKTKEMLVNWVKSHEGQLRRDAIYFLLVNFDEMIIRPYAGFVPKPIDIEPYGLSMDCLKSESEILKNVEDALSIILKDVLNKTPPVSAHEVMKSIDENWEELQNLFPWG
jgi:hypothetical protein